MRLLFAILLPDVLTWLRNRRKQARVTRDARKRVQTLEEGFGDLTERVDAALDGLRQDAAAWKLAARLQARVEALELRQQDAHEKTLAAIQAAHETARSAVNSVKGSRGGRGNRAEIEQFAEFGQHIDAALKTPEGRAALIEQVQNLEANGVPRTGVTLLGDFTPGPT